MRRISFFLTQDQILAKTKTVTRRLGWNWVAPGTLLQPIQKAQGLKAGQQHVLLGGPIRVISIRPERLTELTERLEYGHAEAVLEGFPGWTGQQFVDFICKQPGVYPRRVVNRIEFAYVD